MKNLIEKIEGVLLTLGFAWVLTGACTEFYNIAWGTGDWSGEFSSKWAFAYYAFVFLCMGLFVFASLFIWKRESLNGLISRIIAFRSSLGNFRWLLWLIIFIVPVWFFQYTAWGLVFQKFNLRIVAWIFVVFLLTVISSSGNVFGGWKEFLGSLVLTATTFSVASTLREVSDYPFSLGWSEGNRLWDYSTLFGSERYIYPRDQVIPVLLDFGRQFVGGLPFIFPGLNISSERLWVGLTLIFPYFLLGFAAFRGFVKDKRVWLITILWTFLFLKQGPIHPPLVLSAALVALGWGAPLWMSIPLLVGAGYFAQASRFTWAFAPAMWIIMLEFASASFFDRRAEITIWKRSAALGLSGLLGSFGIPKLMQMMTSAIPVATPIIATPVATAVAQSTVTVAVTATPMINVTQTAPPTYIEFLVDQVQNQPYLWYRLLPNSTYGNGILFALLLSVGPFLVILGYLANKKIWKSNILQKLSLILPLLLFFFVGLVASTKIGGGGDLHNMDMFLIGLLFTGVIVCKQVGLDWLLDVNALSPPMKAFIVFLLTFSSINSLLEMRSFNYREDASRLVTLTDAPDEESLELLPSPTEVDFALQEIQEEVDKAMLVGDVLFIDQRQLLTFGHIINVPLVPEYEKKWLMNEALASNSIYFQPFYKDLAAGRFSLIISEPLRTPIKDDTYQFGEENNAWVTWVSAPVLCYYEPIEDLDVVNVQLLAPKSGFVDCDAVLP